MTNMKHIVVKQKSTFERFKPIQERLKGIKGVKIYRSENAPMCDGTKRGRYEGKDYRHPPVKMTHSGYVQSGKNVWITRWACPICGMKGSRGREGTLLNKRR